MVLRVPEKVGKVGRLTQILSTILFRRAEYQIAHIDVYSGPAFRIAELASILLKLLHKCIVINWHGGGLPAFTAKHPSRVTRLLKRSDLQTAPSAYLLEKMPIYQPLAKVIPNGLYIDRYDFRHRKSVTGRLIWLRAFKDLYNPLLAVEIMACLNRRGHYVSLMMAGPMLDQQLIRRLRERVSKHGLADCLDIRGAIKKRDIPNYLQRGDIFINTSRVDNTPISVIEAMASGLCVVSSDVGGMPFLLTHNYNALLAADNHMQSFADQIEFLLVDPKLAAKLSKNARQTVEQFDWSVVSPKWQAILNKILESEP